MKILEKKEAWGIECICTGNGNGGGGCGSKLLVEENDIYVTSNSSYDGSTDYYYTFKCPVCNCETDINESDVPTRIKYKSLDKYKEYIKRYGD